MSDDDNSTPPTGTTKEAGRDVYEAYQLYPGVSIPDHVVLPEWEQLNQAAQDAWNTAATRILRPAVQRAAALSGRHQEILTVLAEDVVLAQSRLNRRPDTPFRYHQYSVAMDTLDNINRAMATVLALIEDLDTEHE